MLFRGLILCGSLVAIQPQEPAKVRYEDLPAAAQLGVRAESIRRVWPVLSTVVIVPDTGSYIEAIGSWTPALRFPVLIDDGSPAAREDIARFVRGFAPEQVVRWTGKGAPADGAKRRDAVDAAVRRIWSHTLPQEQGTPRVESNADLIARWKQVSVPRTGIVIASPDDPAWTGALALAAGRAQPLAWIDRPPGLVDATLDVAGVRKFEAAIEAACEATGLAWKTLGDDIDAVAVCMGTPGRIQAEPAVILATTDVLARTASKDTARVGSGARWAWAGQILGTEARSAYAAMCSLFLTPRKAWVFDGYGQTKPWSDFDATAAADYLKHAGLEVIVDDTPRTGERAWRVRASTAVDAGLIAVNTKGMANEFHLEPGRCIPADVPVLSVPSIVYLVHSWSALSPIDRNTVGGRWLERGAYAYLGSVDEPFLHAFVPTPIAMGRLGSNFPFAAAVRPDNGSAWKLTTLGDPLTMLGPPAQRVKGDLPLAGAVDLQDDLRGLLERKDFAGAIRVLVLRGQDTDIAALVAGVLKEDPTSLPPSGAEDAILPLFRAREFETMIRAYGLLPESAARRPDLRDALWHYGVRVLPATREAAVVSLMRLNIRDDARLRDSLELAEAYGAVFGHDAAAEMLRESQARVNDAAGRLRLDEEIKRHTATRTR